MTDGNVLFITLDQYRADCIGAWGHPVVRTPNLDRLVARGTSFLRHHANAAPCGPSRAGLYTGLYPMNHRSVGNGTPLDARFTNIALEARALGYEPALFGYTDTSVDPRTVAEDDPRLHSYEGLLPGFDPVLDFPGGPLTPWLPWLAERGYEVPEHAHDVYEPKEVALPPGRASTWRPARYRAEHTESAFLTDVLLAWLDEQEGPWFAHASYLRPHPPYLAPEPWNDAYDPADVPPQVGCRSREEEAAVHPLAEWFLGMDHVAAADDELERRQLVATYYGMIGEVDHQVGRVFDHLERRGEAERTLVVLTSDHGDMLNDHWLTEKLGWWPQSYRVPLVVCDPSAPAGAGRRVEAITEHVDVAPTIVEWLGGEVPAAWDGRSLLSMAGGGAVPDDWRTAAHWQWDFRNPVTGTMERSLGVTSDEMNLDALWTDRWLYVHVAARVLPDLLFDLEDDPHLTRNRVHDPGCASALADCRGELLSWRMRHAERTLANMLVTPRGLVDRRVARVD